MSMKGDKDDISDQEESRGCVVTESEDRRDVLSPGGFVMELGENGLGI